MLEVLKRFLFAGLMLWLVACGDPPQPKPEPTPILEARAANPAWDSFQKAFGSIESGYYGYSSLDFSAWRTQYTQQLTTACAKLDPCSLEVSDAVLDDLIAKINDGSYLQAHAVANPDFLRKNAGSKLALHRTRVRFPAKFNKPDCDLSHLERVWIFCGPASWRHGFRVEQ
jgi:hypothetical protein